MNMIRLGLSQLRQHHWRNGYPLRQNFGHQVLYDRLYQNSRQLEVTSALLQEEDAEKLLESDTIWKIAINGKKILPVNIDPHGEKNDQVMTDTPTSMLPIVLDRQFADHSLNFLELSEEFRHYHNLAEDESYGILVDFDKSGNRIVIANLKSSLVSVKKNYLMRFLAETRYHLAVFVDSIDFAENSSDTPVGLGPIKEFSHGCKVRDNVLQIKVSEKSSLRLMRKAIFYPPASEHARSWPYPSAERESQFIIGHDSNGENVERDSSCWTKGIAHSLTPIYFQIAVLEKYREDSKKYDVTDRDISCQQRWWCPIVTHHEMGAVSVCHTDLRDKIPRIEHPHWRQYNIALHEVNVPQDPAPSILKALSELSRAFTKFDHQWKNKFGWLFYKKLYGKELRLPRKIIMMPEGESEATTLATDLNKLLVEGINVPTILKEIKNPTKPSFPTSPDNAERQEIIDALFSRKGRTDIKPASCFRSFLKIHGYPDADKAAQFIRDLADVRATVTHREDKKHRRVKRRTNINISNEPIEAIRILATRGRDMMVSIEKFFFPGVAQNPPSYNADDFFAED